MSRTSTTSQQRTLTDLGRTLAEGRKLTMLTSYDAFTAQLADAAGVDMILVGDSVGNVCLGFENTLPVSVAMMTHHLEAVARTRPRAFLIVDMPYLSYHISLEESVRTAGAFLQSGAQAVKLEGGRKRLPVIRALVEAEIPVMGHLGLTPQSVHAMGGYRVQAREADAAIQLLEDALALQEAGVFSIVLEGIPADLAAEVTRQLHIPTIGIGAGPEVSGQVLVIHDLLGLSPEPPPKFVRTYLEGWNLASGAIASWMDDIQSGSFPGPRESYMLPEAARLALEAWRSSRQEPPPGEHTI